MKRTKILLVVFIAGAFGIISNYASEEGTCSESTRPHKTQCNKYFRCVQMQWNKFVWAPAKCLDGLVYDTNLKQCAIPSDNWDCDINEGDAVESHEDDETVYVFEDLGITTESSFNARSDELFDSFTRKVDEDDFIEVIDGEKSLKSISNVDSGSLEELTDELNYSGDGAFEGRATISPDILLTTHLQRITQIVKGIHDRHENRTNDLAPDNLNSFLAIQNIKSDLPEFQRTDLPNKTPIPHNGKIEPHIMAEILQQQTLMNEKITTLPTTESMDYTTPPSRKKHVIYLTKDDPTTEIRLNSVIGQPSHQIVVNRPEGSVLFNVPAAPTPPNEPNKYANPYLSEDILKIMLEISKQMSSQNSYQGQKNTYLPQNYLQPIYYAVPVPMLANNQNLQDSHKTHNSQIVKNLPSKTKNSTKTEQSSVTRKKPMVNFLTAKPSINRFEDNYPVRYFDSYGHVQTVSQANNLPESQQQTNTKFYSYPSQTKTAYLDNNPVSQYQQSNQQQDLSYYENPDNYLPIASQAFQTGYPKYPPYHAPIQYHLKTADKSNNRPIMTHSSAPYLDHQLNTKQHTTNLRESVTVFNNGESNNDEVPEEDVEEEEDVDNRNKLVSFAGNVYNYDDFKKNLLPLLKKEQAELHVDILDCTSRTRQPNATDCKQYYICDPATKLFNHYTCPLFTAFNALTRICDAKSYAPCKEMKELKKSPTKLKSSFISLKALEALKTKRNQELAQYLKLKEFSEINNQPEQVIDSLPASSASPVHKTKQSKKKKKKRKPRCRAAGKLANPDSHRMYYLCFKTEEGALKRRLMTCSQGLSFCKSTSYCTLPSRC